MIDSGPVAIAMPPSGAFRSRPYSNTCEVTVASQCSIVVLSCSTLARLEASQGRKKMKHSSLEFP